MKEYGVISGVYESYNIQYLDWRISKLLTVYFLMLSIWYFESKSEYESESESYWKQVYTNIINTNRNEDC